MIENMGLKKSMSIEVNANGIKAWTPHQVYFPNSDRYFMEIDKWSSHWTKMCCKKRKDHEAKVTCNVQFIDELEELRTQACDNVVRDAMRPSPTPDAEPAKKPRKARMQDAVIAPDFVQIDIPGFEHFPPRQMMVAFGVKRQSVYVEMTLENIKYCVLRCEHDFKNGRRGRERRTSRRE